MYPSLSRKSTQIGWFQQTNLTFCTPDHTGSRHQQPRSRAMVLISWMAGISEIIRCSCRAVFLSGQTLNSILYMIHSLLLRKQPLVLFHIQLWHLVHTWISLELFSQGLRRVQMSSVQCSTVIFCSSVMWQIIKGYQQHNSNNHRKKGDCVENHSFIWLYADS